jgi:uncharacterized membrane protein YphA (DoxX/SURF4 family)
MAGRDRAGPHWVDAVLEWRWTWLLARIALVSAYLVGGLAKLSDFSAAAAEQARFGLHPAWLWATLAIVVELGGSALVVSGRLVWLGAGALGVLTAIATLVADNFWTMNGPARVIAMNGFLEHVGLIAGFVMVALIAAHDTRAGSRRLPTISMPTIPTEVP